MSDILNAVLGFGSAGASIMNGYLDRQAAQDINNQNIAWAREQQARQFQAQREQNTFAHREAELAWQRDTEWNRASAVKARMEAAGINPWSATPQGNMSAPAASPSASGVAPVMPQLTAAPSPFKDIPNFLTSVVGAYKSIMEAKKVGVDTKLLERMTNDLVNEQHNKTILQELEMSVQGMNLEWMPKKYQADIDNIKSAIALAAAQTVTEQAKQNNFSADTALKNMQNVLAQMNIRLTKSEIKRIEELLPLEKKVQEAIAYNQTQQGTQAAENAETTRQTREHIVEKAKQDASLAKQEQRAKLFENFITAKSYENRIDQVLKQLELTEAQIKQVKEAARKAKREGNWMWFDKTLGNLLGDGAKVGVAYLIKSMI